MIWYLQDISSKLYIAFQWLRQQKIENEVTEQKTAGEKGEILRIMFNSF